MSLLQKTEDKIERFSLEVANREMEKLRNEICTLHINLGTKAEIYELNEVSEKCRVIRMELDALTAKYKYDKSCIVGVLENFSHLFLSIAANGNWTDEQRYMLIQAQTLINGLKTIDNYLYNN